MVRESMSQADQSGRVGMDHGAVVVPESRQHVVYRNVGGELTRRLRTFRHDGVRTVAGAEPEQAEAFSRVAGKVAHPGVGAFDQQGAEHGSLTESDRDVTCVSLGPPATREFARNRGDVVGIRTYGLVQLRGGSSGTHGRDDIAAGAGRCQAVRRAVRVDFKPTFARTIRLKTTMATRSTAFAVLLSLLFVGCGSSRAPLAQPERDSAASPAAAVVPPVTPEPETTRREAPVDAVRTPPARDTVPTIVAKTFPEAGSVQRLSRPFPHWAIRNSAGHLLGYEAFSDSAGVTAKGYGGTVSVQVFFDSQGKPLRIYVLDNCETPAYLDIVYRGGLLEKLLAFDPAKPESIDAVTLATTSSHALIAGVAGLAGLVWAELVAKPNPGPH